MPEGFRRGFHRVALVEDHALQRERTEEVLRDRAGVRVVCRCESLPQLLEWLALTPAEQHPELIVLDLSVDRGPGADPAAVAALVRDGIKVLVLSALASPTHVRAVMHAGVSGFVGKRDSAEDIVAAVQSVLRGGGWMTPEMANVMLSDPARPALSDQEERALVLYASGLTLDAVAERLGVKPATAKSYVDRVKAKYATIGRPVSSKTDLYRAAVSDGFLRGAERRG